MSAASFIAPPLSRALDPDSEPVVFDEATLWAGDIVVSKAPVRMSTVLGSCVSVCVFDAGRRFGGMNHYLVPRGGRTAIHGDWATTHLLERMQTLGSSLRDLQAKIFGGGSPLQLTHDALAVGTENVAVARQVLGSHGVPLVAERLGVSSGLRLFYENWTGVVWVRSHAKGGKNGT
jgi:chemotaxis protein CheD